MCFNFFLNVNSSTITQPIIMKLTNKIICYISQKKLPYLIFYNANHNLIQIIEKTICEFRLYLYVTLQKLLMYELVCSAKEAVHR